MFETGHLKQLAVVALRLKSGKSYAECDKEPTPTELEQATAEIAAAAAATSFELHSKTRKYKGAKS